MGGAKSKTSVGVAASARNVLARRQQDMEVASKVSISSPTAVLSTPSISTGKEYETKSPKPETFSPSKIHNTTIGDYQQFHGEELTQHVLRKDQHQEHSSPLNPHILKEVSKWTVRKTTSKITPPEQRIKSTTQIRIELDNQAMTMQDLETSIPKGRMSESQIRDFYKTLRDQPSVTTKVLSQSFNLSEDDVIYLSGMAKLATLIKDDADENSFIAI